MKNMRISLQLFMLVGAMMASSRPLHFFQIKSSTTAIYHERYEMLRTQVESAISILKDFDDRAKRGEFSQEEAQKRAYALLNKMKFDPDGYFFGYDYDVVLVFHPTSPSVGKSNKGVKDPNGYAYRDDLVKFGRAGGGYVEFIGPKPGKDPNDYSYPKASYGKVYEPWKIVIITGLYTDDLKAEVRDNIIKTVGGSLVLFSGSDCRCLFRDPRHHPPAQCHSRCTGCRSQRRYLAQHSHTEMRNEIGLMAQATEALQQKVRERHAMAARQQEQEAQIEEQRVRAEEAQRREAAEQAHVVSTIGTALEQLATGDLTIRCSDLGPKYEGLRHNFNDALSHLEQAMSRVSLKGNDIGVSKEEIRRASNELAQRTERQAANLEETSAALDELTVAVRQTADGAKKPHRG